MRSEPALSVRLTPLQRQIVNLVQRAGDEGIGSDRLFDLLYSDDPNGGPLTGKKCLHVLVWQTNSALRAVGMAIHCSRGGRGASGFYRLIQIKD